MVYAENSLHYWRNLFYDYGIRDGGLADRSMGEIMSQYVEIGADDSTPLVKVYTEELPDPALGFESVQIDKRQMLPGASATAALVPDPVARAHCGLEPHREGTEEQEPVEDDEERPADRGLVLRPPRNRDGTRLLRGLWSQAGDSRAVASPDPSRPRR